MLVIILAALLVEAGSPLPVASAVPASFANASAKAADVKGSKENFQRVGVSRARAMLQADEFAPHEPAHLSAQVEIRAAGRGKPFLDLSDGRELLARYDSSGELMAQMTQGEAEPRALASGDYDEDGMADLVTAYATADGGGMITIHRGNVDAVYPNAPAARARKAAGTFSDVPFLSPARVFATPTAPDFITSGDFDADGHMDIITAQRGAASLDLLRGNGSGAVGLAESVALPGAVTALVSGEVNRADGLTDLVVAVETPDGAKLLVFEGISGALASQPEEIALPASASDIVLGSLTADPAADIATDIAVAAGYELLIVRGRDRKLSLDAEAQATVAAAEIRRRIMPAPLSALAVGDFTGDLRLELGAATADGSVYLVRLNDGEDEADVSASVDAASSGQSAARRRRERAEEMPIETLRIGKGAVSVSSTAGAPGTKRLLGSNLSGLNHETLLMMDGESQQLHVWADDEERRERGDVTVQSRRGEREAPATLEVAGEPVAALAMRLNRDGLKDLVVLRKGLAAPLIITTMVTSFVVCNTSDCGGSGCGSLRALINTVNSQPVGGSYAIDFDAQAFQNVPTVTIGSSLPAINRATVIDGASTGACGNSVTTQNIEPQMLTAVQVTSNSFSNGFRITNSSCVMTNLVINRVNDAITVAGNVSNNIIDANKIGTDSTTNQGRDNQGRGVFINGAARTTVGANFTGLNVIARSTVGIDISGVAATENSVLVNNIGANLNLNLGVGNGTGIRLSNGASQNRIGVNVTNTPGNFSNAVWSNASDGILIDAANGNLVQSNWIRANAADGVIIRSASGNAIGGSAPAGRVINFIWASGGDGVEINGGQSTNNLVQTNNLGVDFDNNGAPVDVHNNGNGVLVSGNASGNFIGGATAAIGNLIAFNLLNGVTVASGTGNQVRFNRIFNNIGLAIDLGNDGIDVNDPLDADGGANNKQNYPVITAARTPEAPPPGDITAQAIASVDVTFESTPNTTFTLEFQLSAQPCTGGGHQSSGSVPVILTPVNGDSSITTNANGQATKAFQFDVPDNLSSGFINAQAHRSNPNDSSEISLCRQLTSANACTYTINPPTATVGAASGNGSFTVTTQQTGCNWTAISSDTSWLTTTSTGTGNGTVNYAFAQNSNANTRTATISIGGQTHTVTQAGVSAIVITSVAREGKHLRLTGTGFAAGAKVWVNGVERKGIEITPTSMLGKKAAKGITQFPAVVIVRMNDGSQSNEALYNP